MMFLSFLFTCALSGNMKKRLLMPSRGKTLKLCSAYARRVIFLVSSAGLSVLCGYESMCTFCVDV